MTPAQKWILRFMPLVFGLFFFTFPQALLVYAVVTLAQIAWRRARR